MKKAEKYQTIPKQLTTETSISHRSQEMDTTIDIDSDTHDNNTQQNLRQKNRNMSLKSLKSSKGTNKPVLNQIIKKVQG